MNENSKDTLKFFGALAVVSLLVLVFMSLFMEQSTKVTVIGSNPPQIKMSDSGTLGALRVTGNEKQREAIGPDDVTYWLIEPANGYVRGEVIELLSPITYGKIPLGYIQKYPEQGQAPPLLEGTKYYVYADTVNANHGSKTFAIQGDKVIEMLE